MAHNLTFTPTKKGLKAIKKGIKNKTLTTKTNSFKTIRKDLNLCGIIGAKA